jgi:peptide chain release factor 3
MGKFLDSYPSSIAADLDGAPVFMASSAFNLRYEQERWPKIAFTDIKDYQKAAA